MSNFNLIIMTNALNALNNLIANGTVNPEIFYSISVKKDKIYLQGTVNKQTMSAANKLTTMDYDSFFNRNWFYGVFQVGSVKVDITLTLPNEYI